MMGKVMKLIEKKIITKRSGTEIIFLYMQMEFGHIFSQ
ncbi:unnamed protein product [Musa acuminata subsp. malaccensis]|uniref:(wild Malaysian banana) hypothetical protein n=1 Tax=Musa acuminata subsp. malaccensis TaxID=214687 RepID=A0A8D7FF74_MUSAM|nr:unnamed protein product [Musa acuminata subsp. malaccensis]